MAANSYNWTFNAKGTRDATTLLNVLAKLEKILGALSRREKRTVQVFNNLGDAFAKVDQNIKNLSSTMKQYHQTLNSVLNLNKDLTSQLEDSTKGSAKFSVKVDQSTNFVNRFNNSTHRTIKLQDTYKTHIGDSISVSNDFGKAVEKKESRLKKLGRALTRIAGIWNTWNKAIDFGIKRIGQVVRLFTGWESKLRQIGGQFERSEATLRVLASGAGSSSDEIEGLITTVKQLGRNTEFTARQAAEGAITLVKSGNDASAATVKLEAALDAALATGLEFSKTAKIGNVAWNIFGKNLGRTGGLARDYATSLKIMVAGANSADITVEQLGTSLANGGNILSDLGVPLTRAVTMLGLLANRGVTGGKAVRLLSIGLKRLVDGTATSKNALRELGVSVLDTNGQMVDAGVVMERLGQALDLRAPNEQMRLMKALFGAGDKVMRTLLDAGVSGFDALEDSIVGALDSMTKLKEARADTLVGAWKQFQSAVENVWIVLKDVLRVPVIAYWNTLTSILRKVGDRLTDLGEKFKSQGRTLEAWLDLVKEEGISGLFQGLPEELQPELDTLAKIWEAFTVSIGALFKELWRAIMTPDVLKMFVQFGTDIGLAVGEGLKAALGTKNFEAIMQLAGSTATVINKAAEVAADAGNAIGAAWTWLTGKGGQPAVVGGGGSAGGGTSGTWERDSRLEAADDPTRALQKEMGYRAELFDNIQEEIAALDTKTDIQEDTNRGLERQLIAEDKVVEIRRKQNEDQLKLYEAQARYNEQLEQSKNIISETNVAINKIGESFEQWLLNPIDMFQQKILGAKEKFGDLIDSLRGKKLDLEEKFGLKPTEDLARKRQKLAEDALKRDERLVKMAQTPEEQVRIRERMAERAAGLADTEEGPDQQKYAKRAQRFLEQAATAATEAEDLEIKRIDIQREYAKKNLSEYEAMVANAETAGGRAAALELAQQAYQTLGPEFSEQATRATEELQISKAEAASETAERQKQMAENSQVQVELLQRIVELAEDEITTTRAQAQIPQNPEYASATGN